MIGARRRCRSALRTGQPWRCTRAGTRSQGDVDVGFTGRPGQAATVAGCTGLALGLLDQWLSGHDTSAPPGLAGLTRLPAGHWTGERAARDILTLARKRRAFASLDALIARQGGRHVLYGSALVLAAALQAWARHAGTPLIELARTVVR
jgi:hypothetical protein